MVIYLKKINLISIYFIIYLSIIGLIISSKIKEEEYTNVFYNMNFNIDAESCVVLNNNNEIIYAKNEHKRLLPASITKILTCIVALETFPLDHYIYVTYDMINTIGSKIYLKVGDFIKVEDILYGLMLSSGNDAAKVLELSLTNNSNDFIYLMNKMCKKIGMKNSLFSNASGLDNETTNYTTAYDMALLTNYAIKIKDFCEIFGAKKYTCKLEDRELYFRHKHRLVHSIDNVLGGKTGYTELAGRTLVTSFYSDEDLLTVVTFNSHNDWQIHSKFNELYFGDFLSKSRNLTKMPVINPSKSV